METILDFDPTPQELCDLGITDAPTDPLTDDLRAEILGASQYSRDMDLACLMGMRGLLDARSRYLSRLPTDDPERLAMAEQDREWSILRKVPVTTPAPKELAAPV